MSTTLLKVILDTDKLVFRDIAIPSNENLETLHYFILKAFNFEGKQMASFLKINDDWQIEKEFSLIPLANDDESILMKNHKIADVLSKVGDILSYNYDYLNEWKFEIEVIQVNKETITEAKVIKVYGTAPKESEKNISGENAGTILMNEILGEEDFEDDFFDSDSFDSIDDYEEFL